MPLVVTSNGVAYRDPVVAPPFNEPPSPDLPRVAIGVITAGSPKVEFMRSVVAFMQRSDTQRFFNARLHLNTAGPYLDWARNNLIQEFMLKDADLVESTHCQPASHLVFIDDDIDFRIPDLNAIVAACTEARPVTSGIYHSTFGHVDGPRPVAYHALRHHHRLHYHNIPAITRNPPRLMEVDAIGAGFMCIHRSLLDTMLFRDDLPWDNTTSPWFDEEMCEGTDLGEDLCFCWRVQQMGFPIYVLPRVRVGHVKSTYIAR